MPNTEPAPEKRTGNVERQDSVDRTIQMDSKEIVGKASAAAAKPRRSRFVSLFNVPSIFSYSGTFSRIFGRQKDVDKLINNSENLTQKTISPTLADEPVDLGELTNLYDLYDLNNPVAEGGHAIIYAANDRVLNRQVAIKSLRKEMLTDNHTRNNFIAESKLTAQLDHPAIVPIYSLNNDEQNGLFLAMKMINGKTLFSYLNRVISLYKLDGMNQYDERKSLLYRLDIFLKICDAMNYAHAQGIIHCDLKPENIMIGEFRETYVMDWGIAKNVNNIAPAKKISGTPRYMSPEVIRCEKIDQRSDIFSLGVILFELVTLAPAFTGENYNDVMNYIRHNEISEVDHRFNAPIDADLKAIIRKATRNNRNLRYQTVEELSMDIRRYLDGQEVLAHPDGFFGKIVRRCKAHVKLLIFCLAALLVLIAAAAAYAVFDHLNKALQNQYQQRALAQCYASTNDVAGRMDRFAYGIMCDLNSVANQAGFFLTHSDIRQPDYKKYFHADLQDPVKAPADVSYSNFYRQYVSLAELSFHTPLKTNLAPGYQVVNQLYPIQNMIKQLFARVNNLLPETVSDPKIPFDEKISDRMLVRWIYAGFPDGLIMVYPGGSFFSEHYDIRNAPWYWDISHNLKAFWSDPYIDADEKHNPISTCVVPIKGENNAFLGFVALDMSMNKLTDFLRDQQRQNRNLVSQYVINGEGLTVIDTSRPDQYNNYNKNTGEILLRKFHDPKLFRTIKSKRFGTVVQREVNREVLYCFSYIKSLDWFYVTKINLKI